MKEYRFFIQERENKGLGNIFSFFNFDMVIK